MAEPKSLSDPRSLKAIAHPVRSRLLYELYARGRARAVDLAAAIDVPGNSVSFHLRELARYGLIEQAPEVSADGRDRWWRPASEEGVRWNIREFDESGKATARVWGEHATARVHRLVDRMFEAVLGEEDHGVFLNQNDMPMFLTRDEAARMTEELVDLLGRWTRHGWERQQAGDLEGRRAYITLTYTAPQEFLDD